MTLSLKNLFVIAVAVLVLLAASVFGYRMAVGSVTFTTPTQPLNTYKNFTFFTATTTTATSTNTTDGGGYLVIAGAKKVVLYFIHGGVATTSTAGAIFRVQTSRDGLNWSDYSRLIGTDVAATATSTVTIQGATSTQPYGLDLQHRTLCAPLSFGGTRGSDCN